MIHVSLLHLTVGVRYNIAVTHFYLAKGSSYTVSLSADVQVWEELRFTLFVSQKVFDFLIGMVGVQNMKSHHFDLSPQTTQSIVGMKKLLLVKCG